MSETNLHHVQRVVLTLEVTHKRGGFQSRDTLRAWILGCLNCNTNNAAVVAEDLRDAPAVDAGPLDGFTNMQLLDELRHRGMVISAWDPADIDFIAEDEELEAFSDEQIKAMQPEIFGMLTPGLEDVLSERGNSFLSDKWTLESAGIVQLLQSAQLAPTLTAVKDLKPGDLVDLEGDCIADPSSDKSLLANEYQEVVSIEIETPTCTLVYFSDFVSGFPPEHLVKVMKKA